MLNDILQKDARLSNDYLAYRSMHIEILSCKLVIDQYAEFKL